MKGLQKTFKFKVGLDVDDVLLPCIALGLEWANRDYKFEPPLDINEVISWSPCGNRTDVIIDYFKREDFYKAQTPLPGAKEFVKKLSKVAEIFIVTAISPEYMGIRVQQIRKFFPEIPEKNIIPAYRKDVVDLDFLFDDGAHNIVASNVAYPVLFRRPWNAHMTGVLAANSYDEFLNLLECIKETYTDNTMNFSRPTVVALVGPSASGKSAIAQKMLEHDKFEKPISATTRKPRLGDEENAYHFIDKDEFLKMKNAGAFAETTVYAGEYYGTELSSINQVLKNGKHCVIPIDISGAMALRMQYRTCIVYIKRNRPELVKELVNRAMTGVSSIDDVTQRIVSLDDEKKSEELSDYVLVNDGTLEDAVQDIFKTMRIK